MEHRAPDKPMPRRAFFLAGIVMLVAVAAATAIGMREVREGRAQTINDVQFGCGLTASSHFDGSKIRSYTSADFMCVEDTGVHMQYELGGSWYSYSLIFNSPLYYYTVQLSPTGATDNWSRHQICLTECGPWLYTWVP
jgi:hypothetical protein